MRFDSNLAGLRRLVAASTLLASACGAEIILPDGNHGPPDAGSTDAASPADAADADAAVAVADAALAPDDRALPSDLAAALPGSLIPGTTTRMVVAAGQSRSFLLHVPPAVTTGPIPLVIALHGNGDLNSNFVAALGLQTLADNDGFVLAVPQGIPQSFTINGQSINGVDWDAYRSVAMGNIDLPFLDSIRSFAAASGSIDLHRVFVFGYSQGGYLSFRYGMEQAALLSCAAVIAAANPLPGSPLIGQAARKIAVALQIGTNDFAINNARMTRDELQHAGFPISYNEIAGAGHVPFPGSPTAPLDYCRMQRLP